jgi:hypothetical protein
METIDEPFERSYYRYKCKHYAKECGQCYMKSGGNGKCNWDYNCDGDCKRMKRYDQMHGNKNTEFKLHQFG